MSNKQVITHLENRQSFFDLLRINPGLVVIKFGAQWCRPCKQIAPVVDAFFGTSPENVLCVELDIDQSFDVYTLMKSKKMIQGVPTIMCFKKGNLTFIPDDSVIGSRPLDLHGFFKRCGDHLVSANRLVV
jgi:thioredoxin 1